DNLFLIADRRLLWVDLAVFEQDAPAVRDAMPATIRVDAVPSHSFRGRVTFVNPQLDDRTRTLTVRVEVDNRNGELRPGMYATADLGTAGRRVVSVPLAAVLPTGTRDIVSGNGGAGRLRPPGGRVA